MRNKIKLIIISVTLLTLTVSCFGKKEENKQVSEQQKVDNSSFGTNAQSNETQEQSLPFTKEESDLMISKKIDPNKVASAIKDAEAGNKDAIMAIAKLYFDLGNKEKSKEFLQKGVDRNIPEAIYQLALLYKEENNETKYKELISKLPSDMVGKISNKLQPAIKSYNDGVSSLKSNKLEQAKKFFTEAYNGGVKEADVQLGVINKKQKNTDEAIKWFKLASKRGIKGADYEVATMLFDNGKRNESLPYLIKGYNQGIKEFATPIGIVNQGQGKIDEAKKWYKIAEKNGDKRATELMKSTEATVVNTNNSDPKLQLPQSTLTEPTTKPEVNLEKKLMTLLL